MSKVISEALEIPCAALSGANLATEVAQEQFCESTIGKKHTHTHQLPFSNLNTIKSLYESV